MIFPGQKWGLRQYRYGNLPSGYQDFQPRTTRRITINCHSSPTCRTVERWRGSLSMVFAASGGLFRHAMRDAAFCWQLATAAGDGLSDARWSKASGMMWFSASSSSPTRRRCGRKTQPVSWPLLDAGRPGWLARAKIPGRP